MSSSPAYAPPPLSQGCHESLLLPVPSNRHDPKSYPIWPTQETLKPKVEVEFPDQDTSVQSSIPSRLVSCPSVLKRQWPAKSAKTDKMMAWFLPRTSGAVQSGHPRITPRDQCHTRNTSSCQAPTRANSCCSTSTTDLTLFKLGRFMEENHFEPFLTNLGQDSHFMHSIILT